MSSVSTICITSGKAMNWHLEKTSSTVMQAVFSIQEKIEDTKGVIRSRKSKKERQCNDQASK